MTSTEGSAHIVASERAAPGNRDGPVPEEALGAAARTFAEKVGGMLERSPQLFWQRTSSPELRKVLETLLQQVDELGRLLERRATAGIPLPADTALRVERLLDRDPARLRLDGAWQLVESLQLTIVILADRETVQIMLENEAALEAREGDWEEPWPYYGWGRVRWRDAFNPEDLPALLQDLDGASGGHEGAIERLAFLHAMRSVDGRKRRTTLMLRTHFLAGCAVLVAVLVTAFLALVIQAGGTDALSDPRVVALMAVAGALGGTVSGVLRLRNLVRITEFRLLGPGLIAQPLLGAASALVLLLLLESGLLRLPRIQGESPWAAAAAYGFVAGFLEPLIVGVVRRMVGETRPKVEEEPG
ncbi:MAG: hypothetical protein GEU81_13940 [Nitriliruptorales bacterium]|nr:hypothetical protein [Nitriliruptorales bacterium]